MYCTVKGHITDVKFYSAKEPNKYGLIVFKLHFRKLAKRATYQVALKNEFASIPENIVLENSIVSITGILENYSYGQPKKWASRISVDNKLEHEFSVIDWDFAIDEMQPQFDAKMNANQNSIPSQPSNGHQQQVAHQKQFRPQAQPSYEPNAAMKPSPQYNPNQVSNETASEPPPFANQNEFK